MHACNPENARNLCSSLYYLTTHRTDILPVIQDFSRRRCSKNEPSRSSDATEYSLLNLKFLKNDRSTKTKGPLVPLD
ncbi:hypothetical protein CPB84DRAFT_1352681 [Gymnopilus junonius]|uniref:Uncharacterized protein n=1 Tax=Gymnopilus junonius TaxID=109634 RepID=A0A9P5TTP9_GYMJU|nr:hypothetical protein CPB84DRAFT_1352681 [Gymnopilus junonius]